MTGGIHCPVNLQRLVIWVIALLVSPIAVASGPLAVAISPKRLTVDAQNNATATILISNISKEPVSIFLTADDFELDPNEGMSANLLFASADVTTGAISGKSDFELPAPLAPGQALRVRTDISNLWQAGLSKAVLRNRGEQIAELVAIKDQFPFNVKPVGWKEDTPVTLRFCAATPASIILRNDDLQTYSVDWKLETAGLKPQMGRISPFHGQSNAVPSIENKDGWIPKWYSMSTLLRPIESDGILTLVATARDPKLNLRWKERSIPVKIRRSFWSEYSYQWVTFVILSTFLALGGIASLLLNNWIPNRLKRLSVRELIDSVSSKIRALSTNIGSSLRVGIRVERQRLLQRLRSRSAISPDFAALAVDCEAGAKRLIREVDLLERIDNIHRRIDDNWPSAGVYGPTLLRRACTLLRTAQAKIDRPELSDVIVAEAETLTAQAEGTITSSEILDDKMTGEVAGRVAALRKILDEGGSLATSPALKQILLAVPSLRDGLMAEYERADQLKVGPFCDVDVATTKLELVERFVKAYEAVVDSKKMIAAKHLNKFMETLRRSTFSAYREAISIVEQVEEISFSDDAREEILDGRMKIRYEPQSPKVNQAVALRVEFQKRRLNEDAALNALTCEWHFVHCGEEDEAGRIRAFFKKYRFNSRPPVAANDAPLLSRDAPLPYEWTEEGFSISHYFPSPELHKVWVQFFDEDGKAIEKTPKLPVKIESCVRVTGTKRRAWGERTRIEAMRLAIAISAAIFALLGGAQEQISKVDLVPGLIAVFLLGLSADQIKNVFK